MFISRRRAHSISNFIQFYHASSSITNAEDNDPRRWWLEFSVISQSKIQRRRQRTIIINYTYLPIRFETNCFVCLIFYIYNWFANINLTYNYTLSQHVLLCIICRSKGRTRRRPPLVLCFLSEERTLWLMLSLVLPMYILSCTFVFRSSFFYIILVSCNLQLVLLLY